MKNRTIIIIVAVIGVIGLLVFAAGSTAVLGYAALKNLAKVNIKPNFSTALAQTTENQDRDKGILVAGVASGSPAERAGIVRGDIILKADGQPIEVNANLLKTLGELKAGDKINLQILHGDDLKDVTLELQEGESGLSLGITPCGLGMVPEGFTRRLQSVNGALVSEVVQGGPAEKAGLKVGDVITAIEGEKIDANNRLPDLLAAYKPGDQISLSIERSDSENQDIQVTLGENPDDSTKAYLGIRYSEMPRLDLQPDGDQPGQLPFGELPEGLPFVHPQFSLPEGMESAVFITEVTAGSPAEAAGLKSGDVITAVDGKAADSANTVVSTVQAKKPGEPVKLTVIHNGETAETFVTVTLGENPDKAGAGFMGVKIAEIHQQTGTPGDLPSWLDQLPIPKDFQLPIPPQNQGPSDSGASEGA